jgi:hypothetical protein
MAFSWMTLRLYLVRRVEDNLRPLITSAVASSSAHERRGRKEIKSANSKAKGEGPSPPSKEKRKPTQAQNNEDSDEDSIPAPSRGLKERSTRSSTSTTQLAPERIRATEFAELKSSYPRRLNDIAQAPPTFKRIPKARQGDQKNATKKKAEGVLSMAQRAMMEKERENAIQRYRELKEKRSILTAPLSSEFHEYTKKMTF